MFEQPVVFDASTLLNILATGEAPAILRCVPVPRIVSSVAASEVLHLRNQDSAKAPDSVSLEPLVDAGLLTLATPQTRLDRRLDGIYMSHLQFRAQERFCLLMLVTLGL